MSRRCDPAGIVNSMGCFFGGLLLQRAAVWSAKCGASVVAWARRLHWQCVVWKLRFR